MWIMAIHAVDGLGGNPGMATEEGLVGEFMTLGAEVLLRFGQKWRQLRKMRSVAGHAILSGRRMGGCINR